MMAVIVGVATIIGYLIIGRIIATVVVDYLEIRSATKEDVTIGWGFYAMLGITTAFSLTVLKGIDWITHAVCNKLIHLRPSKKHSDNKEG